MAGSGERDGKRGAAGASLDTTDRAYPVTTPFQETTTLHKVASWLFVIVVVLPALLLANFFPEWNVQPAGVWIAIATVGAALSGVAYVHGRAPHHVGLIGGALCAPGSLAAIAWWTSGRTSVLRIEVAIAFLLGAVPGVLVYVWLFRRAVPPPPPGGQ